MKILITGAAGNLGGLLADHLLRETNFELRLMQHRRKVNDTLIIPGRSAVVQSDLSSIERVETAVAGVNQIVHFAGVLFKANPANFLPTTNTQYFKNLVDAAKQAGVKRMILISFPHVEGPTSFKNPAIGRLDANPISHHAKTRLEEERYLFEQFPDSISLRVGMVYGKGILMIEAARWFARYRLLGVWKEATQIHLISTYDFCEACRAALEIPTAKGIYHVGDEGHVTLQEFLDLACTQWGYAKAHRMPLWMIYSAARCFEFYSTISGGTSPLTKDFIDIGRVSYYGDTTRFRSDLLPVLRHSSLDTGIHTL